jgi:hypothetical protein
MTDRSPNEYQDVGRIEQAALALRKAAIELYTAIGRIYREDEMSEIAKRISKTDYDILKEVICDNLSKCEGSMQDKVG